MASSIESENSFADPDSLTHARMALPTSGCPVHQRSAFSASNKASPCCTATTRPSLMNSPPHQLLTPAQPCRPASSGPGGASPAARSRSAGADRSEGQPPGASWTPPMPPAGWAAGWARSLCLTAAAHQEGSPFCSGHTLLSSTALPSLGWTPRLRFLLAVSRPLLPPGHSVARPLPTATVYW